jgi:hypothetical protein
VGGHLLDVEGCAVSPESYCRDLEAYLCRKNEGHLIRIVGPAFERVSRWAEQGIPFTVACAGVDRYFERYYRKGPRRRPVRIEFCEADVLDAFDDWRRAVGVAQSTETTEGDNGARARGSLTSHLERVIARLTALRASAERTRPFDHDLERIARAIDQLRPEAAKARGGAREALLARLLALDREMVAAALAACDAQLRAQAAQEAKSQLASFRDRMNAAVYETACQAALERHIRDHFGLPTLSFP